VKEAVFTYCYLSISNKSTWYSTKEEKGTVKGDEFVVSEKIKILIADDFSLLREDLSELINRQPDMEVVGEASSAREIISLAGNVSYDIILMDIEMEVMNAGIIATQKIREENPEANIIFLTAHETREFIVTAMGAGASDYMVKGCEDQEILHHIRCAYEGNPVMQSNIHETIMQEFARLQKSERSLLFFINNISNLTPTEIELMRLLLQVYKVNKIAGIRSVEASTIKT